MYPELSHFERDIYSLLCKHLGNPLTPVKQNHDFNEKLLPAFRNAAMSYYMINARGNQVHAAKRANLNRNTLHKYIKAIQGNSIYFARDYNYLHSRFNGQTSPS